MTQLSKSEDVSDAIVGRLANISAANGYETEIGTNIMRGRRKLPADDEPPCIQFVEGGDDFEDSPSRANPTIMVTQVYVIDAYDACDANNPNVRAHAMIRDIKKAIFGDGRNLGGAVREVRYLGKDIGPRPDGAGFVQARVSINVTFVEDLSNP